MRLVVRSILLGVALGASGLANAQEPGKVPRPSASVRRDPNGVTGVSPLWERLAKADAAFAARDLEGALALYREVIAAHPEEPLGYYRLGQCEALRGNLKEAEGAYTNGLRVADRDPASKAKLLFALAGVYERQKAFDQAVPRYEEYEEIARSNTKAKTHPASAADRKKRNQDWKKNQTDSADVKARIEKRAKEASSKSSKAP